MPRPPSTRRTERIQCRLTVDESSTVREQAHVAGMTLSNYFRRRVLGRRVIADVDMTMIRELRRQGGLLKKIHTESGGAYNATTARILEGIEAAIANLAEREKP